MRMLSKSVVALGLAALMTVPAMAQQQRRGGGPGFGGGRGISLGMLLSNTSVQEELKLDDAQKAKAREIGEKAREKFTAARESLQNLDEAERGKKLQELTHEANAEARKAAAEFLKPEQGKRLREIALQTGGASAFEQEHLQKKLNITSEQKTEIASIVQASNQEMREIFQGDREGAMAKLREHRKATLSKIEAKLTPEQKAEYTKLLGAPFELKFEGGRGGR